VTEPARAERSGRAGGRRDSATPSARARRGERNLRERYGLLLVSLSVTFAVQGIAHEGGWQEAVVTALVAVTFVLALRAGDVRPRLVTTAAAASAVLVVVVALLAAVGVSNTAGARIADGVLVAFAPPVVAIGVVRGLREHQTVTIQAVLGVLCVYLLLGMFCAFAYGAVDRLGGDPFFAGGAPATTSNCLYFSFTTLTTVGYGDLTARSNFGHTIAATEALVGQIYLVTVVALIVSNLGRRREQAR
jgi:Ion channel